MTLNFWSVLELFAIKLNLHIAQCCDLTQGYIQKVVLIINIPTGWITKALSSLAKKNVFQKLSPIFAKQKLSCQNNEHTLVSRFQTRNKYNKTTYIFILMLVIFCV